MIKSCETNDREKKTLKVRWRKERQYTQMTRSQF